MRIKRTMYFLIATMALLFFTFTAQGEGRPFITRWKGEANKELKIPIFGKNYKLVIKKASDNSVLITEPSLTITENENFYSYTPAENGELLVEAGPEGVEYIRFIYDESKRGSVEKLLTVEQFGTVAWTTMREAFQACHNMQFAPTVGTPDLSNVTNMECMFYECVSFNQDLSSWNVSNVTNMGYMFRGCSTFNQDLSGWNVSNVTSMEQMFWGCSAFNQNLGSWNLKKCEWLGLSRCGMSVENYFKSLEGWAAQTDINEKLVLVAYDLYFNETGKSARTKLIKEKHWVILGDVSEGGRVYDLIVGGVQVSTDNINSFQAALTELGVLKKGEVSVTLEGEKPVLLLENAELTAPYEEFPTSLLRSGYTKITIQLRGVCTIAQLSSKEAIYVENGTIAGRNTNDKLLVKGGNVFYSRTAIRNCTVEIENVLSGYLYGFALEIDNAVVKAKSIWGVSSLTLKNCSILQPEGAYYDEAKGKVVDKDGNTAENVVIGRTEAVTGVKLAYNNLTLKTGDSFTLVATVEPANATNKGVTWSSDNDAVATVSEAGVVEAKAVGKATITAKTKEGGYTATCEVTVTSQTTPTPKPTPNAVEDAVFANVIVSPNPFDTQLRISNGDVRGKYALYNTQGVEVASGVLETAETRINTISLPAGLYLLCLTAENGATKTFTVVKN